MSNLWQKRIQAVPKALGNNTPLTLKKAQGTILTDSNDKQYIDFAAGIGAMNVGHNHPQVIKAIDTQARCFASDCFHLFIHEPYIQLAQKLNQLTPGGHDKQTMLCNSGAEAVENAVKLARFATQKRGIIAFDGAFHGRTYMGISLTAKVKPYKHGFGQLASDIYRLPYPSDKIELAQFQNDYSTLIANQIALEDIAAIIIEPQLGEGGFIPANKEILQWLKNVCEKQGILFITDEIQTGFCRTGKYFAIEHFNVIPDIMVMGKSIAAGLPLSALTARKELFDKLPVAALGGTNSGNPLACAAALASLNIFEEENLCQRADIIGNKLKAFFKESKKDNPYIGEVRGLGAMIGIEFIDSKGKPNPEYLKTLITKCLEKGLLLISSGSHKQVLRILAPLTIKDDMLEEACQILTLAMHALHQANTPLTQTYS